MKTTISMTALTLALFGTGLAWANHPQGKASGAYAHSPVVSPNRAATNPRAASPHDVFSLDGRYVGRDPDPNVRLQLLRDYESWNGG